MAITIITACMIYLLKKGVSLRLAPVIGPTLISVGPTEMARSIVVRLTPQFQGSHYMILGLISENTLQKEVLEEIKKEIHKDFGQVPEVLNSADATLEQIQNCQKPCWILVTQAQANELEPNNFIERAIKPTGRRYFNLSFLNFSRELEVAESCNNEQRVTFDCLVPLAVRESKKKMKSNDQYYFVRSYNENDYFVFFEN